MNRLLYLFGVLVISAGINACKSSDPEPAPAVVGKWASDRIRISGLVAPYTSSNGEYDAFVDYGVRTNFEVKTDKTFTGDDRSGNQVVDFKGTWDYTDPRLTLKFDDGSDENLTYDATGNKPRLLSEAFATQDSVRNPTTQQVEVVRYNIQLVYVKQ